MMKTIYKIIVALVAIAVMMCGRAWGQTDLIVCNGTQTNSCIPVYGLYVDTRGCNSEFIIPSNTTGMSSMNGKTITKMKFYLSSSAAAAWTATIQVYMTEVSGTTISSLGGPTGREVVYTGTLNATGSEMTVTFDNDYTYNGGNLLVGFYVNIAGNYKSASFYGASATSGASRYNNGSGTGTAQSFLPKVTFTYQNPPSCAKPTTLLVTNITGNSATISWESSGSDWEVAYNTTGEPPSSGTAKTTKLHTFTGLYGNTHYYAYVRTKCSGSTYSGWKTVEFTTDCDATGLPYTQNFDALSTSTIPTCWTKVGSNSSALAQVNNSYASSG